MPGPIDEQYFNWLRAKVIERGTPPHIYLDLLNLLHRTQFIVVIAGDENRYIEALELRQRFLNETRTPFDQMWYDVPCSVLEVLIAFAHRACFETDTPLADWFWQFIINLRLDQYKSMTRSDHRHIGTVLEKWMYRIYDYSGEGGLFPLREPDEDQRQLELWYQFNRYIDDQGL